MTRPLAAIKALAVLAPVVLSGCAIVPDTPMVRGEAKAQGLPVALGESVWQGDTILTPLSVIEDSRCPRDVRCIHAGKLVVSTRITATHWQQTAPMVLGEPYTVMNRSYVLKGATPGQVAGQAIPPGAYRFSFGAP